MSEPTTTKPMSRSRTMWLNILTLAATAAVTIGNSDLIADNAVYAGIAAIVVAAINLGLRLVTNTKIG